MTRCAIDPAYADQLLEKRAPYGGGQDPLITLLAEAGCAAVAAELGDESRALAAFRAAHAVRATAGACDPGLLHRPRRRSGVAGPVLASLVAVAASAAIGVFGYTAAAGYGPWSGGRPAQTGLPGGAGSPAPQLSSAVVAADSDGSAADGPFSRTGSRGGRVGPSRSQRAAASARAVVPGHGSSLVVAGANPRPAGGGSGGGFGATADPVPPGSLSGGGPAGPSSGEPPLASVPPPDPLGGGGGGGAPVLVPAPDPGGQATLAGAGSPAPATAPGAAPTAGGGTGGVGGAGAGPSPASPATEPGGSSRVSGATVRQLCAQWAKRQDRVSRGGAPDFTPLIALAGSQSRVPAYCAALPPPNPKG